MATYVRRLGAALHDVLPGELVLLGLRDTAELRRTASAAQSTPFRGAHRLLWLLRNADRDARDAGVRLLHYSHGAAPLRSSMPFVVTIQDLSLLRMPLGHPPLRTASAPLYAVAAHNARAVIVPSQATRDEVRTLLRVAPARIAVVPHAPTWDRSPSAADAARILERFGVRDRRYVLATGPLEPRKNHLRLVAAFEDLAREDPDLRLVIVGGVGWRGDSIASAIARSPAAARIIRPGYVAQDDFAGLLASCAAFAYVSLYEGYGLPIVDAMAAGVPVVASAASSMPEAAGGAAILVDATSPASIADGIRTAFADRERLVAAGAARVARWTWRDAADATIAVYERAFENAAVDDGARPAVASAR